VNPGEPDQERSEYERFAIPYSFKPRMSVRQAAEASLIAFLRIFLGSLLFALWGSPTLALLSRIPNWPLRIVVFTPLLVLFAICFALLMRSISRIASAVRTSRSPNGTAAR
jgi:hypothetical protein